MELNGKYYLRNEATDEFYEVSKEEHDAHKKQLADFSAKIYASSGVKPVRYITGTAEGMDGNFFKKLWDENK